MTGNALFAGLAVLLLAVTTRQIRSGGRDLDDPVRTTERRDRSTDDADVDAP